MKLVRYAVLMVIFAVAMPAVAAEPADNTVSLNIPRVTKGPTLQQFIDGMPREAEATATNFRQREPHDGDPVSQPTTAYLSYDDKNLYIAFVCKDDPKLIRAKLSKREDLDDDDWVAIVADTFHDHRRAIELFVNPLWRADGMSWDAVWQSEANIVVLALGGEDHSRRLGRADDDPVPQHPL